MAGIEPATDGLQNRCSTTELHWLKTIVNKSFYAVIQVGFLGTRILNLYMYGFSVMKTTLLSPTKRKADAEWVKTPYSTSSVTNLAAIILGVPGSMAS